MAWKTGIFNNQSFLKHSSVCLCSWSASIHLTKIRSRSIYYGGNTVFPFWQKISLPSWKDAFLGYVYLGVPATTLTVFYFLVFKKIRKHQQNVRRNLQSCSTNENITSRDQLRSQRSSSSPSLAFWHVGLLLSS